MHTLKSAFFSLGKNHVLIYSACDCVRHSSLFAQIDSQKHKKLKWNDYLNKLSCVFIIHSTFYVNKLKPEHRCRRFAHIKSKYNADTQILKTSATLSFTLNSRFKNAHLSNVYLAKVHLMRTFSIFAQFRLCHIVNLQIRLKFYWQRKCANTSVRRLKYSWRWSWRKTKVLCIFATKWVYPLLFASAAPHRTSLHCLNLLATENQMNFVHFSQNIHCVCANIANKLANSVEHYCCSS